MARDPFLDIRRDAVFDASGRYRYSLTRQWEADRPTVAFLLLNPSTADDSQDDPTIRRCMGFAREWGYGGLEVVNLFAFRSTRPSGLLGVKDPVGAENDRYLLDACARAHCTVAAWGIHGALLGRGQAVAELVAGQGLVLQCLGVTKARFPRHVLYLRRGLMPRPFPAG